MLPLNKRTYTVSYKIHKGIKCMDEKRYFGTVLSTTPGYF